MDSWRRAWRVGIAPSLSTEVLRGLRQALETDDKRLIQGRTAEPPPLTSVMDWPCNAGCALGFAGMLDGNETVAEVEEYFSRVCYEADQRMEPGEVGWFINWFDETPRDEMRRLLSEEIDLTLAERRET